MTTYDIEKTERLEAATGPDGDEAVFCWTIRNSIEGRSVYKNIERLPRNNKLDMEFHIDVIADKRKDGGGLSTRHIDVKSIQRKNFETGNYCVGLPCIDYIKSKEEERSYDFAFRLVENGGITDKFIVVDAIEIINKIKTPDGPDGYCLIGIDDIRKCKSAKLFEPDI